MFGMAHTRRHAHTEALFVVVTKGMPWKCGYRCAMVVTTCEELAGRADTYTAAPDSTAKHRERRS